MTVLIHQRNKEREFNDISDNPRANETSRKKAEKEIQQ